MSEILHFGANNIALNKMTFLSPTPIHAKKTPPTSKKDEDQQNRNLLWYK